MPASWQRRDGVDGLASGRIGKPEHPQQRQVRDATSTRKRSSPVLHDGRLERQREHTLASSADLVDPPPPITGIERLITVRTALPFAHLQDSFRRALGIDKTMALVVVVQRRHEAVFGFERDYVGAARAAGCS